jgi:hypothetical protein
MADRVGVTTRCALVLVCRGHVALPESGLSEPSEADRFGVLGEVPDVLAGRRWAVQRDRGGEMVGGRGQLAAPEADDPAQVVTLGAGDAVVPGVE